MSIGWKLGYDKLLAAYKENFFFLVDNLCMHPMGPKPMTSLSNQLL